MSDVVDLAGYRQARAKPSPAKSIRAKRAGTNTGTILPGAVVAAEMLAAIDATEQRETGKFVAALDEISRLWCGAQQDTKRPASSSPAGTPFIAEPHMGQADTDLIQWCAALHEITRSMKEELRNGGDDDFAQVLELWHENADAIISTRARHPASLRAKAGVVPIMLAMVGPEQAAELAQSLASDILSED